MPLLPAMLLQAHAGEGAEVAMQVVLQHMPAPDQSQPHLSTPSWQQTSDPNAQILEHGQKDAPVDGTFHISPQGPLKLPLHTRKRKMVVSDSDQKDGRKQDVDLDALRALANAVVTVDSNIPSGGTSQIPATHLSVPTAGPPGDSTVPPGASIVPSGASTVPAGSPSIPANVFPSVAPAGVSNKGKSLMVEEDFPVEANAYISKTLLGDDVSKENFPARMAALLRRKKQALAEKLAKERQNRPMTQAQQRAYIQIQAFSMTLKRSGPMLEEPSSKRQKSTETTILSMPELPHSPVVSSPPSSRTRMKSFGQKHITKHKSTLLELDLDAAS
uniref:JmjC domain-containing protein n=1 Tax=Tanacetum cinerariifolium TaxID=118510 RepID=A0A699I177_TANCI|nr:hypothetical protein [Tanacetum cinerariifolium]